MKKYLFIAVSLLTAIPLSAQETYQNAKLVGEDLNGTARYVGMGGAMEALGADISTISSNPAGIGLFRRSTAAVSFGLVMLDDNSFDGASKTKGSFDQIGFVYSTQTRADSYINFAFNYHKGKNFNQILSAANTLGKGSSQNLSFQKGARGSVSNGGFNVGQDKNNVYIGYYDERSSKEANTFSQIDYLNWNMLIPDERGNFDFCKASDFEFGRVTSGYIGNYDFNISGNIHERVYLGVNFGFKDVHYRDYSQYKENVIAGGAPAGSVTYWDEREITGSGFDVSVGAIVRPVEYSPFRIGVSVKTPTWYSLNTSNYTSLKNESDYGIVNNGKSQESYDFKVFTPWKFGVSLGHTVGNYLALGASYDYEDYSATDPRINDGVVYEGWDAYETSTRDRFMKNHTEKTLKSVSTLKIGAEVKASPEVAVRVGYNYVSPAFNEKGQKDGTVNSPGSYYASTTDYTNWKSINRVTCGVGYSHGGFTADLAYQYSAQKGDFYPFMNAQTTYKSGTEEVTVVNECNATKVNNNRHQLLLTLGYRF